MAIGHYLDASVRYVTKADLTLLKEGWGPLIANYVYGAFIYAPDAAGDWREVYKKIGFSSQFLELLDFACERNIHIIHLNADGDDSIKGLSPPKAA